ncbi:28S ribosomal protein S5, mitochondrial [Chelonus insularis]|uniref:28S ribosomal protein S5, mitochondrial n=1 Tax=Chelonus insularis TaxID=460826 RepID=UPI001588B673|nr:28S ribosomal protein S5, mitochondrial [Chelonus insularis]
MAYTLIRACNVLTRLQRPTGRRLTTVFTNGLIQNNVNNSNCQQLVIDNVRHASFFNRYPADYLWKGATAVSNAGKKRGRLKSRRPIRNLNRGQVIGVGRVNIVWPGLNAPVLKGRELVQQQRLPDNPEQIQKIYKLRDTSTRRRRIRIHPLLRGWTSAKPGGRKIGPPDPVGDEKFEGFETIILQLKQVTHMTGHLGRTRNWSALVITGNGQGLAGFGEGRGSEGKAALRKAKNRAAQRLIFIKRYNERTVFHDFFCQFGGSKIFVYKKGEGFGLRCQRVLKACCEVLGIKDLRCKIEGSTNTRNVMKAFFIGLLRQKTHQEIAEEKKLHLVEFRRERDNFPVVVASPAKARTSEEIKFGELLDFKRYAYEEGKVPLDNPPPRPFYERLPSWTIRQRKIAVTRNKEDVRVKIMAEEGDLKSFYSDEFKEANPRMGEIIKRRYDKMKEQQEQ